MAQWPSSNVHNHAERVKSLDRANELQFELPVFVAMCILGVVLVVSLYNLGGKSARFVAVVGILAEYGLLALAIRRSSQRRKALTESLEAEIAALRSAKQELVLLHGGQATEEAE